MRAWHPVQLYICGFIQLNLHSKNALQNTHTVIYTYRQQSPRWHKWQRHAYYPFSDCSKYWLNDRLFKVPIWRCFSISRDLAQCERGLRGWDPWRVWYSISNTTEIFYAFANGLSSDRSPSLYNIYSSIHTFYLWPQLEYIYISAKGTLDYIE